MLQTADHKVAIDTLASVNRHIEHVISVSIDPYSVVCLKIKILSNEGRLICRPSVDLDVDLVSVAGIG